MRLVNELFFNDVPEIQHIGNLRPVLFISAARIIGYYNEVVRYITTRNIIFMRVMKAEKLANIDNIRVAQAPAPLWNVVLKAWSQKITDEFCNNNIDQVSQNTSLIHQTVDLGR